MTSPDTSAPRSWPPFIELVQHLRDACFSPGATELVNAGRLLRHLEERGEALSPDTLRARLRPIFCKSREDQSRFDDAFREWIDDTRATSTDDEAELRPPKESPWRRFTTFYAKSPQIVWYFAALFVVVTVFAIAVNWGTPLDERQRPELKLPAVEQLITKPIPVPRQVEQYYPAARSNDEVNTSIVWGIFLPLVAILLFVCAPAWFLARTQRRQMSASIKLDERSLHEATQHIVPTLASDIATPLERHTRESRTARGTLARRAPLHMRRTIEATMRNFGIPELHFRHTNLRPSYLMLIDAEDEADPRGRLFYMWANRLRQEGLDVDIRMFHRRKGEAPVAYRLAARGKLDDAHGEPLDRLPDPPVGQRLIVVSDRDAFTGQDGRLLPWVESARFYRWRNRALFTLIEPQDWDLREQLIEQPERAADPGFLVLPLEEDALRAWATLLVSGELPNIVLSEPQRYPRLLAEGRYDFLSDDFSNKEVAERLIAQLKLYLGDNGFQWLAALAVAPVVRHPLTLLIGERFFRLANVQHEAELRYLIARNYRRLARLPWLRRQCMPNWLRLLLLEELPPETHERIREVVRGLLEPLSPTEGPGMTIELDSVPDPHGARVPVGEQSVAICLGYLGGMSAQRLAMRIPEKWANWIRKRPARTPARRFTWRNAASGLRDELKGAWAELAYRGGMVRNGTRGALWIVVAGLMICALVLVAASMQRKGSHSGMLLSEQHHPISYVMRGTRMNAYGFSPDGDYVLTAGDDGRVQNWSVRTGEPRGDPLYHASSVTRVAFCGRGDTAVTTTSNGAIQFWHLSRGVRDGDPLPRISASVRSIGCDDNGQFLAVTYDVGTVDIWDMRTRQKMKSRLFGYGAYAARFVNDADTVIVASSDGVFSWAWRNDEYSVILKWDRFVNNAFINLDGSSVITLGDDVACLWNLEDDSSICPPKSFQRINAVALSPDGSQFMVADERTVQLWSVHPALRQLRVWQGGGSPVSDVGFSPDGQHLVIGDADRATLWTGENNNFAMSLMDLNAMHSLVSALMAAHPVVPTLLWVIVIAIIGWLNARRLRHRVVKLSSI
ncbi:MULTISPECIES: WD40 repeat domain-containing protein [Paraburkholderia]|uniref:Uncharacterized protein n=1 Tax=Paraburkholderia fynbosensis TaxID=1200993 RepID=A0A6J5GN47_9BURK|nr:MULTISPECIES: hypothetical protein [Paraburkholderia]MBC8730265.1 hypothetical protein [Paraburkholderia sp. UCT2]CAB3801349.1 hypothetical protein LMG27177_05035 [Paraburkholderia fynbosensis]